ncbi:nucleoporin Nup35 [Osmia bicornis bicornis]|uniref:nucleoporin Nup35 n=1 Tax=Osmia bicornis bicornis TaxID=1437191 RepID=UPI0010F994C5|nr:nucleoporin Nup35 [Osmia bicornis bicornis]
MEPMTLGSPVGSPVQSPGSPVASAYLPSFLLGDSTTPAKVNLASPQETPKQLHIGHTTLSSPLSHYGTPDYRTSRQKAVFGGGNTPNTSQMVTESHTGGPPTRGLFDTLETSQTSYMSPANQSIPCNQTRNLMNTMNASIFNDSSLNPNKNESQGLLQWVTVFGFPPSDTNTVLAHISSRVRIVDKHPPPHAQSNWIHLKCASEQEAQRALACNGNIVSGSIMIGVIPCTDEGVILGSDKENRSRINGSIKCFSNLSRLNQSPEYSTPHTPVRIPNARPLAAGYNQLSPQSVRVPENVPQKSTGLVSKAMEYMFGW